MNVIDMDKDFYQGIKDNIVSGLDYGWFDKNVAQRIARCYGLTRADILNYDLDYIKKRYNRRRINYP